MSPRNMLELSPSRTSLSKKICKRRGLTQSPDSYRTPEPTSKSQNRVINIIRDARNLDRQMIPGQNLISSGLHQFIGRRKTVSRLNFLDEQ